MVGCEWFDVKLNFFIDREVVDIDFLIKSATNNEWEWTKISKHKSLTINHILTYPDKPWNWIEVSKNPGIKKDDVKVNKNLPFNWIHLVLNPNFNIYYYNKFYPNQTLSRPKPPKYLLNPFLNPTLTFESIQREKENKIDIDFYELSNV